MIDVIRLVLESLLISVLFIVPGILIDSWLAKTGIVRADKSLIIISTLILVFIKQIWFNTTSWWLFGVVLISATTLGVHRGDFTETMRRGRWWWKSEKRRK